MFRKIKHNTPVLGYLTNQPVKNFSGFKNKTNNFYAKL